jgi:hypothetical protein
MTDPLSPYCLTLHPGGDDLLPGPAWSYAWGDPGRAGIGGVPALPSDAKPIAPDPARQYFGGGGGRSWRFADEEVYDVLRHGDDVSWRAGSLVLYRAMARVHPKVQGDLTSLIDDILAVPLTLKVAVDPPKRGKNPTPEAKLAATILTECQESIDRLRPSADFLQRQILWSLCVEADAAAEPVWEATRAGRGASYRLRTLATLPREAWAHVVGRYRSVVGYAGRGPDGSPIVLPPAKLAVASWMPAAGDPRGTFLLRSAYPYVDFQWRLMDPAFQFADHFAAPLIIGMASPDSTKRDRMPNDPPGVSTQWVYPEEELSWALATIRGNGYLALPAGATVAIHPPQGDGGPYLNLFAWCDDQIDRAILGDERAGQATTSSRAEAEIGERTGRKRVQDGRKILCDWWVNLLRTQTEMNYGPEVAAKLTPYVLMREAEEGPTLSEWAAVGYRVNDTTHQGEIDAKNGLTPREIGKEESTENRAAQATIARTYEGMGVPTRLALKRAGWTDEELTEYDRAAAERQETEKEMARDEAPATEPEQGLLQVPSGQTANPAAAA